MLCSLPPLGASRSVGICCVWGPLSGGVRDLLSDLHMRSAPRGEHVHSCDPSPVTRPGSPPPILLLVSPKRVQVSAQTHYCQRTLNKVAQMFALARGARLAPASKHLPLSRRGFAQTSTRRLPVDPAAFVQQGKKVRPLSSAVCWCLRQMRGTHGD